MPTPNPLCTARLVGVCRCGTATDLRIDPWLPAGFQQAGLDNSTQFLRDTAGRAIPARELSPCCQLDEPSGSDSPLGDPQAWWEDPNRPEASAGAFGFLIHRIEVGSPLEQAERVTSVMDAVGCRVRGRRFGRIVLEAAGTSPSATDLLVDALFGATIDAECGCSGVGLEIWDHCHEADGRDGRRLVTDVRGWFPQPDPDQEPVTSCGRVIELAFSAGTEIFEPGGEVSTAGGRWLETPWCRPDCPTDTETVFEERHVRKQVLQGDLKVLPDGSRVFCPLFDPAAIDAETAASTFFSVRNVELVAAEDSPVCLPEICLDVSASGDITVDPLQPDIWDRWLAQVAEGGLSCEAVPSVVKIVRPNDSFNPLCDECPPEVRAAACAELHEVGVGSDGFLTVPALTFSWTSSGGASSPQGQAWLDFMECAWGFDMEAAHAGAAVETPASWRIERLAGGATGVYGLLANGVGSVCDATWAHDFVDEIGLGVAAGVPVGSLFGGASCLWSGRVSEGPNPMLGLDDALGCASDLPANCDPFVEIVPSGSGPACVSLLLDPETGQVSSDIDLSVNDPANMRFEWAGCVSVTSDLCDAVIPAAPDVTINIGAGGWAEDGWLVGQGWPGETPGSAYVITATEWGANSPDPLVEIVEVQREVQAAPAGPCRVRRARRPAPDLESCFPCGEDELRVWVSDELDLAAGRWAFSFELHGNTTPIPAVEAWLSPNNEPVRKVRIHTIDDGVTFDTIDGVTFRRVDGCPTDAGPWLDRLTCGTGPLRTSCSTSARLIVLYPWCHTEGDVPEAPVLSARPFRVH